MLDTINEEIAHVNGLPRKLIIFLHGYIDNADHLNKTLHNFIMDFDNTAIHLPQAPIVCEILEDKRQWYSMHRFDPNDDRKIVSTLEECTAIYDRMTLGLEESRTYLDEYIDNCLNEYQLKDKDLYLCGFSQGAMLALHTAIMRENKIGGCISFSGIAASHSFLQKHFRSTPDTLLIHGDDDNLVRFSTQKFSKEILENIGCKVECKTISGGQHRITDNGLKYAKDFIAHRQIAKRKIAI